MNVFFSQNLGEAHRYKFNDKSGNSGRGEGASTRGAHAEDAMYERSIENAPYLKT